MADAAPLPTPAAGKDSLELSVDLTKQFLTLGLGAIAFVVGGSISGTFPIRFLNVLALLILFSSSVLFGLVYMMQAVHRLQVQRYDVYQTSLRWCALLQILVFGVGVFWLGILTLHHVYTRRKASAERSGQAIEVRLGSNEVRYPVFPNSDARITVGGTNQVEVDVKSVR